MITLKKGITVYKAAYTNPRRCKDELVIIELFLPKGTRVNKRLPGAKDTTPWHSDKRKRRADKARVKSIATRITRRKVKRAYSGRSSSFKYEVGKVVRPAGDFDTKPKTCSSGIHFFASRRDAEMYYP